MTSPALVFRNGTGLIGLEVRQEMKLTEGFKYPADHGRQ